MKMFFMKWTMFLTTLLLLSCNTKKSSLNTNDVVTKYEGHQDIIDIKTIEHPSNEMHYWLHTGHMAYDGPEYIINSKGDTVCSFQGMVKNPCLDEYRNGEWKVIYSKKLNKQ